MLVKECSELLLFYIKYHLEHSGFVSPTFPLSHLHIGYSHWGFSSLFLHSIIFLLPYSLLHLLWSPWLFSYPSQTCFAAVRIPHQPVTT